MRISLMLGLVALLASFEAQQVPPRDAQPAQVRMGTASIAGAVTDGVSGAPVRRVTVMLTDQASSVGGRMTVTADDGRFTFRNLPTGRYLVTATKAAYLPTAYGVNKPMRPGASPTGSAIALSDGQQETDVVLRMTRGSVVTGTVRGTDGQPLRGANVSLAYAFRAQLTGDRTLAFLQSGGAVTNFRGEYRMFGVPPGEYVASVRLSGIDIGMISNDLESTTDADVRRISEMLVASRSPTTPSSATSGTTAAAPRRPTYGYATVFYPGTTSLSNATPMTLGPGEERSGIDFQIQLVPQSRVSGVVTGPDGRPAAGIMVRLSEPSPYAAGPFLSWLTATTDAQGQFVVRAVPAGEYVAEVRPGFVRGPVMSVNPTTPPSTGWARRNLSIAPGDDAILNINLQPSRTVSGQITIDPASTVAPPDFTRARIALMDRDGLNGMPATVTADGRFTIPGVLPDTYRLTVSVPSAVPGVIWFAKSSTIAGRDVLDGTTEVSDDATSAAIVLTTQVSEVSGTILDGANRPAKEYFIVIFPADKTLWAWQSRRIQMARPASDGKFSFKNLPAGEYLIGAVTDVEQNQWFEPAFLSELLGISVKITLADGEKKVQDIRLR